MFGIELHAEAPLKEDADDSDVPVESRPSFKDRLKTGAGITFAVLGIMFALGAGVASVWEAVTSNRYKSMESVLGAFATIGLCFLFAVAAHQKTRQLEAPERLRLVVLIAIIIAVVATLSSCWFWAL